MDRPVLGQRQPKIIIPPLDLVDNSPAAHDRVVVAGDLLGQAAGVVRAGDPPHASSLISPSSFGRRSPCLRVRDPGSDRLVGVVTDVSIGDPA